MKKYRLTACILTMLALSACSENNKVITESPPTTIGFVVARNDHNSPYLQKVYQTAEQAKLNIPNLTLMLENAEGSVDKQYAHLDKMIEQGAKALVINLVDGSKGGEYIKKYCGKVPLVFYVINPGDKNMAACEQAYFVNSDPAQGSVALGLSILENWKKNPQWDKNKDGQIQLAIMDAFPAQAHTKSRGDWVMSTIENYPVLHTKAQVLLTGIGRFQTNVAEETTNKWLADPKFEQVEVIVSSADSMSYGIVNAMQKNNKVPIPLFSVNRLAPTEEMIKNGQMVDSIETDFHHEVSAAMRLAMNLANKQPLTQGLDYHIHDKQLLVPFIVSNNQVNQ